VAGEPCSPEGVSGGSCCSAACLDPTGSGTPRCQYLGGCRIQDDLCTSNEQCCSGSCEQNGVTLDGRPIMRCANTGSCQPIGEVCFQGASANCCPNGGGTFGCETTSTGIDRCYGGEGDCTLPGQSCATTDECCKDPYPTIECQEGPNGELLCCMDNGSACAFSDVCCCGVCAPDDSGALVCCPNNQTCVPTGGACTADGDCCEGCCDDATGTCTTDQAICGECLLGQLGDLCMGGNADCCNNVDEGGPVVCTGSGEFPTCQLQ
jgi:hypothetical protein